MAIASCLLFVLGCLGAADIFLFHSVAHGIRSHPDSRWELVTHSLRGPTYGALFLLVPNFVMQGFFAWLLPFLLAVDVAISVWDFVLERASRQFLGGLPTGEYVLHMVMAMVFGALAAVVGGESISRAFGPPRFSYEPEAAPDLLRLVMAAMAVLVLVSGLQDAAAALRLTSHQERLHRKVAPVPESIRGSI
jgi:hypothetical protein